MNEASHAHSPAPPVGHNRPRNPGVGLDASWFEPVGVNASAVERRAASLAARRSVKKEYQAAWLVRALTCVDLTTLAGDDTPGRVHRLCAKARHPLDEDILEALGLAEFAADRRRGLRLPDDGRARRQGAGGVGDSRRLGRHGVPRRPDAAEAAPRRNRLRRERRRRRDRHRRHARPCAQSRLDGALRRSQGDARGVRRGPSQGDSRHRRSEDASQRLFRQHGRDAGRRRFHQDLHRQGGRQRHACPSVW